MKNWKYNPVVQWIPNLLANDPQKQSNVYLQPIVTSFMSMFYGQVNQRVCFSTISFG